MSTFTAVDRNAAQVQVEATRFVDDQGQQLVVCRYIRRKGGYIAAVDDSGDPSLLIHFGQGADYRSAYAALEAVASQE